MVSLVHRGKQLCPTGCTTDVRKRFLPLRLGRPRPVSPPQFFGVLFHILRRLRNRLVHSVSYQATRHRRGKGSRCKRSVAGVDIRVGPSNLSSLFGRNHVATTDFCFSGCSNLQRAGSGKLPTGLVTAARDWHIRLANIRTSVLSLLFSALVGGMRVLTLLIESIFLRVRLCIP